MRRHFATTLSLAAKTPGGGAQEATGETHYRLHAGHTGYIAMTINGTAGDDDLNGTSGNDVFNMAQGGNDTVNGGGGNDTFRSGGTFHSGDSIDGGTGTDKLVLDGDYAASLFINSTMLQNVENIVVNAGHSYELIPLDGVIADGQSMTIDGRQLGADDALTVDGSYMTGASANTTLVVYTNAAGLNVFTGGPGDNILHGGDGFDTAILGNNFDAHDNFDGGGGTNFLQLNGDFSAGLTHTPI